MASDVRVWDGTAWTSLRGPKGDTGTAGPTVVSSDAGNFAKLGTDSRILVSTAELDARYVNATGDTLSGGLMVYGARTFFAPADPGEPYAVGFRNKSSGGAVYVGATDSTTQPGIQFSGGGGFSLMQISNTGNITNAGTSHTFAAGSIKATAISGLPAASTVPGSVALPAGAVGNSTAYARADHSHPAQVLKADDLSDVSITGTPAAGQVLRFNGTGNFVNAQLSYADLAGAPAATTPSVTAGLAATVGGTVGVSTLYARADHTHPAPSLKADDLTDVTVTTPAAGQVLRWNGTGFANASLSYADITGTPPAPSLKADDLTDVTVAAPATGQVLRWNGSAFVNASIAYADITGAPSATSRPFRRITAAYTIAAADADGTIANASTSAVGVVVTIPSNATTALPVGTAIDILDLSASSETLLTPAAGVTLNWNGSLAGGAQVVAGGVGAAATLRMQGPISKVTLYKTDTDSWAVFA
jgi:uncharacterized protein YjbI with pentapeptide repeats